MTTPTIYRFDDPSAPTIAAGTGMYNRRLCALLKACLVDGYGSKAPAGWTLQFDSIAATGKAVFRSADNEFAFQVDDSTSSTSTILTPADSFSDVNTPVNNWGGLSRTVYTSSNNSAAESETYWRQWIVIATANSVMVLSFVAAQRTATLTLGLVGATSWFYAGKMQAITPYALSNILVGGNDAGAFFAFGPASKTAATVTTKGAAQRSIGGLTSQTATRLWVHPLGLDLASNATAQTTAGDSYRLSGNAGVQSARILAPYALTNWVGEVLGFIPHMKGIQWTILDADYASYPVDIAVDGVTYMCVPLAGSATVISRSTILIDAYSSDWA